MTDLGWAPMIGALATAVGAPNPRVAGVLFWYSLSATFARAALVNGHDPNRATVVSRDDGWPHLTYAPRASEPEVALAAALTSGIAHISAASGARARALWAVATDSVATVVLDDPHPQSRARAVLSECGPAAPAARFDAVPGRGLVVRRGSCCLIYQCSQFDKCLSCPRQTPDRRRQRLMQ